MTRSIPDVVRHYTAFFESDARQSIAALESVPPEALMDQGRKSALATFRAAAVGVPAYRDFLSKHGVLPDDVGSYEDFEQLPVTSKSNYLSQYSLSELCLDGRLSESVVLSSSSGSTGVPCYWPRLFDQDMAMVRAVEMHLVSQFDLDQLPTLLINTYGLGVWTAGECVSFADRMIAAKYPSCTAVSPGLELDITLRLLADIAPYYGQTVIWGYPAFVRDVLDHALDCGIDLHRLGIKVSVGGEPYTENWRDHVADLVGSDEACADISSILGSSEGALVGMETPICAVARKMSANSPDVAKAIFTASRIPSTVQYHPLSRWLEVGPESTLLLTSHGAVPLVRYDTRDVGTICGFDPMLKKLHDLGTDCRSGVRGRPLLHLPVAMVWGRADAVATIYGVNIYPETVDACLHDGRFSNYLSGRFVMSSDYDDQGQQSLCISAELRKGMDGDGMGDSIQSSIHGRLLSENSEYARLHKSVGDRVIPRVVLKPFGASGYFDSRNKHRFLIGR